jgi:hypothetical protein
VLQSLTGDVLCGSNNSREGLIRRVMHECMHACIRVRNGGIPVLELCAWTWLRLTFLAQLHQLQQTHHDDGQLCMCK